eukprot:TRINITY_DN32633_c0_g1_i1.p1 TRINITY_DN32633_c0_g1~~TRINITY_DN32633_c0_g1_i1.p1  ORF type:complete len:663 (+),score=82.73 TRINITY_DN32633_c0_g1_i1:111-2099(+)
MVDATNVDERDADESGVIGDGGGGAEPAASVMGVPRLPREGSTSLAEAGQTPACGIATVGESICPVGFTAEQTMVALGVDQALPPLSGGTTFGAETANKPRMRWKNRQQYVLVLMGYCIGVGNLWRFPYLCGKYGGGAFLVAYGFTWAVCAAPLFFYESVLGQKFQNGPVETFRKMAPRSVGLAYIPVVMVLFYLPYYMLIVAYSFHYFLASFSSPFPWVDGTTPEQYLYDKVLWRTDTIDSSGGARLNGRLFMEVVFTYVVTVLCLVKGIHSAGKAAYVTVILPAVMLVILTLACIRLDGASDGLRYYLVPRFESLLDLEVWGLAAGQIIFSLSPGTGTCIALASYNEREDKNAFANCAIVSVCNSAFSLVGGVMVFSVVGNLAKTLDKPVEEVAASGEGLAFIVFAQGLALFPGGQVWGSIFAVSFFLTLFLLGLDSAFAVIETLQTYVNDFLLTRRPDEPITVKGNAYRLVGIATFLLMCSIPYSTRSGYFLLEIADHYVCTYSLTVGVLLEYIMIGYVYGAETMVEDVQLMTGIQLPKAAVWQIRYWAPTVLVLVVMCLLSADFSGRDMARYPAWANWIFGLLPVICCLAPAFIYPIRFRLRRFLYSSRWTPEAFLETLKRARSGGFRADGFSGDAAFGAGTVASADSASVSLSANRY